MTERFRHSTPSAAPPCGAIDGVREGTLYGWARNEDGGDAPAQVLVEVGSREPVVVCADRFRPDLARSATDAGYCGFQVRLPPIADAMPAIRAVVKSSGRELANSPFTVDAGQSDVLTLRLSTVAEDIELVIDVFQMDGASGWLRLRRDPSRRPMLDVLGAGRVLARTRACRYRADCAATGTDGFHGFALAWSGHRPEIGPLRLLLTDTAIVLAELTRQTPVPPSRARWWLGSRNRSGSDRP